MTFSWAEIDNAAGYQINLYLGTDREVEPVNSVENDADEASVDFTGLLPTATYTVEVIALAEQNSEYANSEASILEGVTEKLTLPTPTNAEIEVSAMDNTITVEAIGLPSAYSDLYPEGILNYRVSLELENARVGDELTLLFPESGEVVQVFENLEAETEYVVVAIASSPTENLFNDSNPARFTATTDQFPELVAPMLTISDIDVNSATVSWEQIANATTYTVSVADVGGNQVGNEFVLDAAAGSQEITSLEAGTAYTVRVVASAPRYRDNEATTSFTTLEPQLQAPIINVVDLDATDATIEWDEVENAQEYTVSIEGPSITEGSHPPS